MWALRPGKPATGATKRGSAGSRRAVIADHFRMLQFEKDSPRCRSRQAETLTWREFATREDGDCRSSASVHA